MLHNKYWSCKLIGHYHFWVISPKNSTSFTTPFLAGRRAWAGHKTRTHHPLRLLEEHFFDLCRAFVSIISDSDDSDVIDEPAMQQAIKASVHAVLGCLLTSWCIHFCEPRLGCMHFHDLCNLFLKAHLTTHNHWRLCYLSMLHAWTLLRTQMTGRRFH